MKLDSEIRRDVQNELQWDPSVDETGIGVNVKDGVVTLIGHVAHYADRYTAEEIAKRVSGVRAIANEIEKRRINDKRLESLQQGKLSASRVPALVHPDQLVDELFAPQGPA